MRTPHPRVEFSLTSTIASEASVQRKNPVANGSSVPSKLWPMMTSITIPTSVVIEPQSEESVSSANAVHDAYQADPGAKACSTIPPLSKRDRTLRCVFQPIVITDSRPS